MWGRGWGGVGHVNVPCTLHTLLMFRTCQDVGQGLGWGGACVAKKFEVEAVCHQRKQFTRKTAQKASTRPCLAGTQMKDRAWRSSKFEWLPAHINATQKKDGHSVLSPIVSELVFQWAWRQHQGPMSPTQSFTALQRLLKHWKKWDETKIRRCSLQEVLMNKRQCELQKVTEMPRPSVRRVPSWVMSYNPISESTNWYSRHCPLGPWGLPHFSEPPKLGEVSESICLTRQITLKTVGLYLWQYSRLIFMGTPSSSHLELTLGLYAYRYRFDTCTTVSTSHPAL